MRNFLLHIPILFLLAAETSSQVPVVSLNNMKDPETKIFYSQEFPRAGDTLHLKVTIPQGWHINANRVLDEFLIPSSVEPVTEDITFGSVLWPEPLMIHNEVLDTDLLILQDSFTVSLPVGSVSEAGDPYKVKLKFTYQACSNICLAPKTLEVSFGNMTITEEKKNGLEDSEVSKKIETKVESKQPLPLLKYFLLALLGGLLLNIMPCVLPVLFLKMFDLIQRSDKTKNDMLKWALASAGGIWSAFFAIAAIICIVRVTGAAIGWGFQFQYPAYTAGMAVGVAIFALSFFGVFDIWIPSNVLNVWDKKAKEGGTHGAFAYGILLVCLSTPCSAPFLGTAMGFALTKASIVELFLIFAAVATGLSLPYLILGIFPQWIRKLPQPGSWMVILKQFLGFPLLLTSVWLVWIFCKQMGAAISLTLVAFLCFAGFFAWLSGLIANPGKPWHRFAILWATFIVLCIFLWSLLISSGFYKTDLIEDAEWFPFSITTLDSLQNEGIAVWVNGTADWCITCKVNEKKVFENEKVKRAFAKTRIAKMQADYTKPNYEALKFFELRGRGGVPFDLLLTSSGEAILLPELLTIDTVLEVLEKAY
jgi:thiol:disulfide interchange protein DsbD